MKIDINCELEKILFKRKLIKELSCDKAIAAIHDLEKRLEQSYKIGLYGIGIEAEGLLYFISNYSTNFKIDYCFDKTMRSFKYKEIIRDSNVHAIEDIAKMEVDYLILGSYAYRQVFYENLDALNYQGKVIDLFSCLGDYIEDHYMDYKTVYQTKQEYLKGDKSDKIELLRKLIKEYILLKDFINAFSCIDEYVKYRYPDFECFRELKEDLLMLLAKIRNTVNQRSGKDIIINWIDALSYYDIPSFPFLYQKMQSGVSFENAYTVMPWTTETTKTILFGKYPIEEKLFLIDRLSESNAALLKTLDENGYIFGYCGMPKFAKLFCDSVVAPVSYFSNKFSGSMQKQWDAINILCQNEKPMCILVHTLRETHEPFICGEGETFNYYGSTEETWSQEGCKRQAEISGKYIDKQLEFYEKLYPENAVEIYMSDHGRVGNSPMSEKKIHIMLAINGSGILRESVNAMFSLVNFPELIKKIVLGQSDWNKLTNEYIIIENLDAYDERVVSTMLSGKFGTDEMYQCRGIVTLTDRYYLYAYGKEYYFRDRWSNENEIHNPKYKKRVNELKKKCGREFIDIFQYDKFKFSRLLYSNSGITLHIQQKGN